MKKEIGKNVSSGAEKVERIEEEKQFTQESVDSKSETPAKKRTTKKTTTMSKSKAPKKTANKRAVKKEKAAANKRVEAARRRAEKKEEKLAKKTALKQKRVEKKAELKAKKLEKQQKLAEKRLARKEMIAQKKLERKARREELRAEKAARRELLKNETKAERSKRREREKRERLAHRRKQQEARQKAREAKYARRAEDRKHKREQKTERRRSGGFGGWLAAVISLGTACLVLASIVTAGAFRMNDMAGEAESGARSTLYEMVSVTEDLDDNLGKLRISAGANEQRQLLTDILVDSALLEVAIERMPVDQMTSTDISSFVNNTGRYARTMLARLAAGDTLSEADKERIASLYEINDKLYNELNDLVNNMSADDLRQFLAGGGDMGQKFAEIVKGTHENTEIAEAPFSKEGNIGENRLTKLPEVSSSEAEELAKGYFESYHIKNIRYTGETVTQDFSCYDFVLTDENDVEIFAQLSKNGGKLVFFDTYEPCSQKNFNLTECDALAKEFLAGLGITDVEAVWLSDAGMVANLTYTTVESGVRIYPELIRIRVCEEKGRVVGMDARSYLLNDKEYNLHYSLTEDAARARLANGLEPYAVNMALIPVEGREVTCYEFGCTYGEEEYIVYLDAVTGEEVQIFRVMSSAKGSYLR